MSYVYYTGYISISCTDCQLLESVLDMDLLVNHIPFHCIMHESFNEYCAEHFNRPFSRNNVLCAGTRRENMAET